MDCLKQTYIIYVRLFSFLALTSCISAAPKMVRISSDDSKSTAHAQAYVTDTFSVNTAFESRDTDPRYSFFYKECELDQRRAHVTKIEYSCHRLPYSPY